MRSNQKIVKKKIPLTDTEEIKNIKSNSNNETSIDDTKKSFEKIPTNKIPIEGIPST